MEKYTNLEILESLENFIQSAGNEKQQEVLHVLQSINGRNQGLIDFYAYYFTANYNYDLMDIIEFLAEEQNQTKVQFIKQWLSE